MTKLKEMPFYIPLSLTEQPTYPIVSDAAGVEGGRHSVAKMFVPRVIPADQRGRTANKSQHPVSDLGQSVVEVYGELSAHLPANSPEGSVAGVHGLPLQQQQRQARSESQVSAGTRPAAAGSQSCKDIPISRASGVSQTRRFPVSKAVALH